MWCDNCREFQHLCKGGSNAFTEGTDIFKIDYVKRHDTTKDHKDCTSSMAAKLKPQETPLAKLKRQMNKEQQKRYNMLFNTAFTVAKHNMSFREFEVICRLQALDGHKI